MADDSEKPECGSAPNWDPAPARVTNLIRHGRYAGAHRPFRQWKGYSLPKGLTPPPVEPHHHRGGPTGAAGAAARAGQAAHRPSGERRVPESRCSLLERRVTGARTDTGARDTTPVSPSGKW